MSSLRVLLLLLAHGLMCESAPVTNLPIPDTALGALASSCASAYCQPSSPSSSPWDGLTLWLQLSPLCGPYGESTDPAMQQLSLFSSSSASSSRLTDSDGVLVLTPWAVAQFSCFLGLIGLFLGFTLGARLLPGTRQASSQATKPPSSSVYEQVGAGGSRRRSHRYMDV